MVEALRTYSAWVTLRDAVTAFQEHQQPDGSALGAPAGLMDTIRASIAELASCFPHDAAYLEALDADLARWQAGGFEKPDFLDSLTAFNPSQGRADGRQHLVVFAMYTQNGSTDRHLEAVLIREVWPEWLAGLERDRYDNPMFVPVRFDDFTSGYDTHSAVLFPETVAVRETPGRYSWGAIFCDREAARFRAVTSAAADTLGMDLPDDARALLADQARCEEAYVLWDLVHDRTHSHGDLPFDPFMIRQRQPFWMYGLEELRCDLTAFREAGRLLEQGVAQAADVQHAILFDRLFRFPVSGTRVRNYDGLGGQLLFAYLHQHDALRWTDNRLRIDFAAAREHTAELGAEIERFYRAGIDRPKLNHWLAGHALVSSYLSPHPASRWARAGETLDLTLPPRQLVDDVLPDEFPLSMFYEALSRKLGGVIESTRGVTGRLSA
ncbi:MAG: DUF6421 family protein [Nocardioidaceae bacterium]|nr:DUF6421 family protein [Nocardioidaceae bacterium]